MLRKKLYIMICILLSVLLLGGCSTQQQKQLPKLMIGYDEYRPFSYIDENGNPSGICMEIAKEACRRLQYEPVFREIEWDNKDSYLRNGEIDCIWGCFSMNGLEEDYSWVGPYMNGRQVVAVLQESEIQSLQDLSGKRIAVKIGTQPESIFLDETDITVPQAQVVYCLTDVDEIVTALRNDYVDACAGYSAALRYQLEKAGVSYRFLDEDLMHSKLGIAFRKDSETKLREKIDTVLQEMQEDGTTRQILESYGLNADKALGGIYGD